MCAMISGLFIGSNDGRPPQAYKENLVSLSGELEGYLVNQTRYQKLYTILQTEGEVGTVNLV